jgi:tripartite-type tricarboxylate transporter receptor subunit TctC
MLARCHAAHARALALRGDARASDRALNDAERALERGVPGDEPSWITYFTPPQLAAESMYVATDLGRGHTCATTPPPRCNRTAGGGGSR